MHLDFKDKKVLVRVDFNVPLDKDFNIIDDTRMVAALPTIKEILTKGGTPIILSHFGRPLKKLTPDGQIDTQKYSLIHIVAHLSKLLGQKVYFATDCIGEVAEKAVEQLQKGEVLLLENTRFHKGEKEGDLAFAKALYKLGDLYVNDAFGAAHRAHASTYTLPKLFAKKDKCFGLLMEKELSNGAFVLNKAVHPFTAIVGGAKVSDKIELIDKLLDLADNIIIGGGMAYTFALAQGGQVGQSLVEKDKIALAEKLIQKSMRLGKLLLLPIDTIVADSFSNEAKTHISPTLNIGTEGMGLDIGPKAIVNAEKVILESKTILWNGPMGVFEMAKFAKGTEAIAKAVAKATQLGAYSLIGGGDSVSAIKKLGLEDAVSYVSTGGGAMLQLLEGKTLPGVEAIEA